MQSSKPQVNPPTMTVSGGIIPIVSPAELKVLQDYQKALNPFGGELLLFGSRARRDHCDDSDFDFWLRIPKTLHAAARSAIPECDFSVGLLLLEPDETFPLFDATRTDQIKVTDILDLADALGPFAQETPRKPPKPFTVDVATPDALLSALLDNFRLERSGPGFKIIETNPGHPFGAYTTTVPDSSADALLQAGLLEQTDNSGVKFTLSPHASIAWEIAGAEGGECVDPHILTLAKQESESCVKQLPKMRF